MRLSGAAQGAALTLLLLLCAVRGSAAPLRISYSAIASNTAGIWMAEGSGAFKKHGLDTQLVYISSSATNVQALLGGSIDIMVGGSSGIVSAAARGAPIVAIGSQMNRPPATLYVQPEITAADQLKSQVLGISRYNSSTHVLSILVLRKLGMEKLTTLRVFGDIPAVQVAFDRKTIAGMVSTVKPKGPARAIANAADLDIPYAMSVFGVSRSFLQANRPVVERFLKAYAEGVAMMVFHKDRAMKILAEYLHRADPAFLEETYTLVRNYTERIPRVDPRVVPLLLEFDPVKGVDAVSLSTRMIDNSIVDRLVDENYLQNLFGKELR